MKTFNPINREYVAPVDLATLQNTYNILEQGHKDSVETASKLKQAIGQIDLNENESAWKQAKMNEVQTILQNGTEFGNAIGAYDDLITASTDMLFGADMQGRIKRQQAWKANNAKIDAMNIPENYKAYFKEMNPYGKYEDKFDTDGNVIEGEAWTPNKTPVNSIDTFKLYSTAVAIAGKDAGGGENVTFLDANGNETPDINKSADKIWYAKRSGKYERLSEDKIRKAINAAIALTPGAEESLRQDWEIANWELNKSDTPQIVPGVTDSNGNALDFQRYKEYTIKQFAGAAAYNHSYSSIDYNTAYQKTAADIAKAKTANGTNGNVDYDEWLRNAQNPLAGGAHKGIIASNVDSYKLAADNKNISNNDFVTLLGDKNIKDVSAFITTMREAHPDKKITGPGTALYAYFEENPNKFDDETKQALINSARNYVVSNMRIKELEKGLDEDDKEKLRFNNSLSTGEFKAGNSRWDDIIIKANNNIWDGKDEIYFDIDSSTARELARMYEVDNITELNFIKASTNGDGYHIIMNSSNRNYLPEFAYKLNTADENTQGTWRKIATPIVRATGFGRNRRYDTNADFGTAIGQSYMDYINGDASIIGIDRIGFNFGFSGQRRYGLERLAHAYEEGTRNATNLQQNMKVTGGDVSVDSTKYRSQTHMIADMELSTGAIDNATYNTRIKQGDDYLKSFFSGPSINAGKVWVYKNGIYEPTTDKDIYSLINFASIKGDDKTIIYSLTPLDGIKNPYGREFTSPIGYTIDIAVDKELSKLTGIDQGNVSLLYTGPVDEGTKYKYGYSTDTIAKNALENTKRSGLGSPIIQNNRYFDNTEIQYNYDGSYTCNFGGKSRNVSYNEANEYAKALVTLQQMNAVYNIMFINRYSTPNEALAAYMSTAASGAIEDAANTIAKCTGINPHTAYNNIIYYIQDGTVD